MLWIRNYLFRIQLPAPGRRFLEPEPPQNRPAPKPWLPHSLDSPSREEVEWLIVELIPFRYKIPIELWLWDGRTLLLIPFQTVTFIFVRFVELNSLEHEKGEDFFSMDRGLFLRLEWHQLPLMSCYSFHLFGSHIFCCHQTVSTFLLCYLLSLA